MRVTATGEVTIPERFREQFGLTPGVAVEFEEIDGLLVLRKVQGGVTDVRRLAERMRGAGDVRLSTDEIMSLTRDW